MRHKAVKQMDANSETSIPAGSGNEDRSAMMSESLQSPNTKMILDWIARPMQGSHPGSPLSDPLNSSGSCSKSVDETSMHQREEPRICRRPNPSTNFEIASNGYRVQNQKFEDVGNDSTIPYLEVERHNYPSTERHNSLNPSNTYQANSNNVSYNHPFPHTTVSFPSDSYTSHPRRAKKRSARSPIPIDRDPQDLAPTLEEPSRRKKQKKMPKKLSNATKRASKTTSMVTKDEPKHTSPEPVSRIQSGKWTSTEMRVLKYWQQDNMREAIALNLGNKEIGEEVTKEIAWLRTQSDPDIDLPDRPRTYGLSSVGHKLTWLYENPDQGNDPLAPRNPDRRTTFHERTVRQRIAKPTKLKSAKVDSDVEGEVGGGGIFQTANKMSHDDMIGEAVLSRISKNDSPGWLPYSSKDNFHPVNPNQAQRSVHTGGMGLNSDGRLNTGNLNVPRVYSRGNSHVQNAHGTLKATGLDANNQSSPGNPPIDPSLLSYTNIQDNPVINGSSTHQFGQHRTSSGSFLYATTNDSYKNGRIKTPYGRLNSTNSNEQFYHTKKPGTTIKEEREQHNSSFDDAHMEEAGQEITSSAQVAQGFNNQYNTQAHSETGRSPFLAPPIGFVQRNLAQQSSGSGMVDTSSIGLNSDGSGGESVYVSADETQHQSWRKKPSGFKSSGAVTDSTFLKSDKYDHPSKSNFSREDISKQSQIKTRPQQNLHHNRQASSMAQPYQNRAQGQAKSFPGSRGVSQPDQFRPNSQLSSSDNSPQSFEPRSDNGIYKFDGETIHGFLRTFDHSEMRRQDNSRNNTRFQSGQAPSMNRQESGDYFAQPHNNVVSNMDPTSMKVGSHTNGGDYNRIKEQFGACSKSQESPDTEMPDAPSQQPNFPATDFVSQNGHLGVGLSNSTPLSPPHDRFPRSGVQQPQHASQSQTRSLFSHNPVASQQASSDPNALLSFYLRKAAKSHTDESAGKKRKFTGWGSADGDDHDYLNGAGKKQRGYRYGVGSGDTVPPSLNEQTPFADNNLEGLGNRTQGVGQRQLQKNLKPYNASSIDFARAASIGAINNKTKAQAYNSVNLQNDTISNHHPAVTNSLKAPSLTYSKPGSSTLPSPQPPVGAQGDPSVSLRRGDGKVSFINGAGTKKNPTWSGQRAWLRTMLETKSYPRVASAEYPPAVAGQPSDRITGYPPLDLSPRLAWNKEAEEKRAEAERKARG